jgi:shikimate dehydrogenase
MRDLYAVIGNPISHSKSPEIHTEFARITGQSMTYTALFAPRDAFLQTVNAFARKGGMGLNITVPFKEAAFRLANRLSGRARVAGAVNTLMRERDGWYGDNTDGAGLVRDLTVNLRFEIRDSRILLLGAGGAARGILAPLLQQHPRSLTLANRTLARAQRLQREVNENPELAQVAPLLAVCDYDAVGGETADLIINATSASLHAEKLSVPSVAFEWAHLAYDLMYGVGLTSFLALARDSGTQRIADGIGMLIEQAAESFYVWRGIRPPTERLIARLKSF